MTTTVCEAKALLEGTDQAIVYRGIATNLERPQDLPTTMIQDNGAIKAIVPNPT